MPPQNLPFWVGFVVGVNYVGCWVFFLHRLGFQAVCCFLYTLQNVGLTSSCVCLFQVQLIPFSPIGMQSPLCVEAGRALGPCHFLLTRRPFSASCCVLWPPRPRALECPVAGGGALECPSSRSKRLNGLPACLPCLPACRLNAA